MLRNNLHPIIFLMNNDGYTIERVITDRTYNDIQPWKYHKLVEVFGGGAGAMSQDVHTEGALEHALVMAASAPGLVFIELHTGRLDCPESLRSAGESMAETSGLSEPSAMLRMDV